MVRGIQNLPPPPLAPSGIERSLTRRCSPRGEQVAVLVLARATAGGGPATGVVESLSGMQSLMDLLCDDGEHFDRAGGIDEHGRGSAIERGVMQEALSLARTRRRLRGAGRSPHVVEPVAVKIGPVVHRYSGEVLLRPKTCRVTVDAHEAAANLRAIVWQCNAMEREKTVPWVVQQLTALHAHAQELAGDSLPADCSTGWHGAGSLARAMLYVQNHSLGAPILGNEYKPAMEAVMGGTGPSGLTAAGAGSHRRVYASLPGCPAPLPADPYWPSMTRAITISAPSPVSESSAGVRQAASRGALSWQCSVALLGLHGQYDAPMQPEQGAPGRIRSADFQRKIPLDNGFSLPPSLPPTHPLTHPPTLPPSLPSVFAHPSLPAPLPPSAPSPSPPPLSLRTHARIFAAWISPYSAHERLCMPPGVPYGVESGIFV